MDSNPKVLVVTLLVAVACQGCSLTSHRVTDSKLGSPTTFERMERALDQPGPVEVETVNSCGWEVALSGLLNLDSPEAKAAGLTDHPEPIKVFLHVLHHPKFGTYLVDTGVAGKLVSDPGGVGVSMPVRYFMSIDKMHLQNGTGAVIARVAGGIQGVFFTHLHLDHISGMPEVAADIPLYVGRGEAGHTSFQNLFVRGTTDRLLEGKADLREWPFAPDPATGRMRVGDVIDIFGDGSVFAISAPGHTQGSTAYVMRTAKGPVLLTGDVSHTRWGWEHGVEPGSYTEDQALNRESLKLLKELSARHPGMDVRLGHQYLGDSSR